MNAESFPCSGLRGELVLVFPQNHTLGSFILNIGDSFKKTLFLPNSALGERKLAEIKLGSLLADSQMGNVQSYALFLSEIKIIIERYVQAHWYDKNSTDDVVQTILFSLHKCRHTYDSSLPLYPWLFSIARCRLVDELRKVQKHKRLSAKIGSNLEDFMEASFGEKYSPEKSLESSEKSEFLQSVEKALEEIPERQKQAVMLLKAEEKSVRESAEEMGISEGALKVLAHRGYAALRKVWKGGAV